MVVCNFRVGFMFQVKENLYILTIEHKIPPLVCKKHGNENYGKQN